ncbi:DNA topoisomerase-1 [Anaerovibrio lipolyticus DSM 3074]|uniref:DNA topoisomerase 1 n=1 Tax=Anaerovibrio lipolyticus DSM 3074 TaxID=1120997 RepID=A0A1M6AF80_9FIRM|nr:type I DNA topoisomerase [Anaerovibrio lipolyticus]SHI34958.1 DNA topoisomerase-1 [Anaerovibrio lipolyticus DSM 3074]
MTATQNEDVKKKKTVAKKTAAKKTTKKTAKKTTAKSKKTKDTKNTLVLVESPTKAKTIERYLGKGYVVKASMGHLRDLPKSQFAIDVDNNFEPKYINIRGKGDLIKELKKEAKKADKIYLASDPDREGEAIAWHLAHIFDIDSNSDCRIVFNEITKPAIQAAVKDPHSINLDMVDAQQARRMLDRIVGYKLSPLLWRKVRKGLSAGRVQSVTVKLICDREKEIKDFVSVEYWTIGTKLKKGTSPQFEAELSQVNGKKLEISKGDQARAIQEKMEACKWKVSDIKERQTSRKAAPPFTTSSLQQDAARKLGFTSKRTMMVAQQLYEGIDLGRKGPVGLITYMRTDSVRISEQAQQEAKEYILENFGEKYYPAKANVYSVGKKAQDAHEAIRPTSAMMVPQQIEKYLSKDQFKLYQLIWQRFVASQMVPAVFDRLTVTIKNDGKAKDVKEEFTLKSTGSKMKFAGFTAVYTMADTNDKDVILPDMTIGDEINLFKVNPVQHFTEPPPRYNDASLVKTLEEMGIGRPSTYAPIIETILARGYVQRISKSFQPTELGDIVVDMLKEYFKDIVDAKFTADLEGKLDSVAVGKMDKTDLLREFYGPFAETLEKADEAIGHVELPVEVSDVPCDICGRMMVVKQGRFGKFLACPGFPECRNTKAILKDTGVKCPKCDGHIVERKSRRGKGFYGCNKYPECDFVSWDAPIPEPCPECGSLQLKHYYRNGRGLVYCYNADCKTRIDHPINKELLKQAKKAQKAEEAQKSKEEQNG